MTLFTGFAFRAIGATRSANMPDRLADVVDAKRDFGVVADGVTDDTAAMQAAINAAFVVCTSSAQTQPITNRPLILPRGQIIVRGAGLTLTGTFGAIMRGAGRFATQIINADGGNVITTQGCQYSRFSDFLLQTSGTGVCFELDWDGVHNCALQSNQFENMFFLGGAYGCRIANGGFQGSENLFLNCFWELQTTAGLYTAAGNALQNTVIGGNFQDCNYGIWVAAGSVTLVESVGFQLSTLYDIRCNDSVSNNMVISACRSESPNFVQGGLLGMTIDACLHVSAGSNGNFINMSGCIAEIKNCQSTQGQIAGSGVLSLKNSYFWRTDFLNISGMWSFARGNNFEHAIRIDDVLSGVGIIRAIHKQRLTADVSGNAVTRTLELEATALTDFDVKYDSQTATVTISIASPGVVTLTNHKLAAGTPVVFSTTGALPTGLTAGTVYYVISAGLAADSFRVSATSGGVAVNTSGSQSGVQTINVARTVAVGDIITKSNGAAGGSPGWFCTTAGVVGDGAAFKALPNVAA